MEKLNSKTAEYGATTIKLSVERGAPINEDFRDSDGWTCKLVVGWKKKRTYTFPFYKGYGHNGVEPDVIEVLDCLCTDAYAGSETFEGFCSEYGYDRESTKAKAIYGACQKTASAMYRLFGNDFDGVAQSAREIMNA